MHSSRKDIQEKFGSINEVQHQKLTCSQLMYFLRMGESSTTDGSLRLMQQPNIMAKVSVDPKVTALFGAKNDVEIEKTFCEVKVSESVFSEKSCNSDFVTSSWKIETNTELWDTLDFFNLNHSLPELSPQNNIFQDYWKIPDLSGISICSSVDQSWAMEGYRDPPTPMDVVEDVHVNVKIPEFPVRKFVEIPVIITHIVNPDKFFILHEDTHLSELSEILLKRKSRSFAEMKRIPDIGSYVMAWFPKQNLWCRSQVCKICRDTSHKDFASIEVEVRRIDYGDVACIALGNVKELFGEIGLRPVQTLQVSLANVTPANGENWSLEAISWFKKKVENKTLYARLYPERGKVLVEVFMEKGKIGAMRRGDSLSVKLAQHGYAKNEHQRAKRLKSHIRHHTGQQSSEWEKYLISCYCRNRK